MRRSFLVLMLVIGAVSAGLLGCDQTSVTAPATEAGDSAAAPASGTPADRVPGENLLPPIEAAHSSTTFRCGDVIVRFTPGDGDMADMQIANNAYAMQQVVAASGAKYENLGNPDTVFWNKGDGAFVSVDGTSLPECRKADPAQTKQTRPFTARGNEPGWHLQIDGDNVQLVTDYGATTLTATVNEDRRTAQGRSVVAGNGTNVVTVTIDNQPCHDDMSGEPFSHRVTVAVDGQTLTGCGGRSGTRDITWRLEDLNGAGIIDRSRVTLLFGEQGELSGSGGCNRYRGRYTLEGERLIIEPQIAATLKACGGESLMAQEQRFLELLPAMVSARIDESGGLVLSGPQEQRLRFQRAEEAEQPAD